MATGNNIKNFTAQDIEKYHKGLLSAQEKHDLEKAALDDPFLADALEGYAVAGINAADDLAELKQRLTERTEKAKVKPMHGGRSLFTPFLRVAAMLIILVGAGLLVYQFAFNKKDTELAQTTQKDSEVVKTSTSNIGEPTQDISTTLPPTTGNKEEKSKDTKAGPVGNVTTTREIPASVQDDIAKKDIAVESANEKNETRVVTAGAPSKPTETASTTTRKVEAEAVKDEAKTKTTLAKKQDGDKEIARSRNYQQPDGAANNRDAAGGRQQQEYYNQNRAANTFRGRVTDATNRGLPFANVTNMDDHVGTYTDAQGYFALTSPDSILNVQIRSLGYDNTQVQLRKDVTSNKVVLQEDSQNLSEVVISRQKPNTAARASENNRKLVEPEPQDGWDNYDSYLANNLNAPGDFKQKTTTDNTVQVSFEVDKNGEPVNIRVEKSLCPSCDKEAIRLVKEGPKWKRNASKKGRTTVTINF